MLARTVRGVTEVETRPALDPAMMGAELDRWYWLRAELVAFARVLGVPTGGGKVDVQRRVAAHLDGRPEPAPVRSRPRASAQLTGPLDATTVVPRGQRCSQPVRAWLAAQVGAGFRFDETMRSWFAEADGTTTLGDAVAHWHATRDDGPKPIAPQFEYNRFTRQWRADHPDGSRADLLAAWHAHRSTPVDARVLTAAVRGVGPATGRSADRP